MNYRFIRTLILFAILVCMVVNTFATVKCLNKLNAEIHAISSKEKDCVHNNYCQCITPELEQAEADAETAPVPEPTTTGYTPSTVERPPEYEYAQHIWDRLKEEGYSDVCSAGIVGNIMGECGGCSLKLNPFIGTEYYGICQWSREYFPEINGADFETQLDFLIDTMQSQFGRHYEGFTKLTNVRDAATSFARFYERGTESTFYVRMNCAERAYKYFTKE